MKSTFALAWCLVARVLVATALQLPRGYINFESIGGIADDTSYEVAHHNGVLFNTTINQLMPGDVLHIPANKTFSLTGGIKNDGMKDVVWQIDGTLRFDDDRSKWPNDNGHVWECIFMKNIENVLFTSSDRGVIDGNGKAWWGAINFLLHQENRPRLLHIKDTKNITMENLLLKDSPFWTFYAENSDGLVIRHTDVDARWTKLDNHTYQDLQAFNTDGFDVTGRNVYIHDSKIWCQDDCITVKDGSRDMFFERISCSGLGIVIGSIGHSVVNNITFRDCDLPSTVKGIYMKTRWSNEGPIGPSASISNILYENITMTAPQQFAIWIGPAQQTGQPCSLLWLKEPHAGCKATAFQTWTNITLKDVFIKDPKNSPGVLFGNSSNPMTGVVFDNVVVTNPGVEPWGSDSYFCEGVDGIAKGGTYPVPPCFKSTP